MYDAIKAVFPAGTVSGAPKIRAMEIIDELEPETRGPYAGAVGYFSFNGCCDFAIAIRSIFYEWIKGFHSNGSRNCFRFSCQNEWIETEHKANAMITCTKGGIKMKFLIIDNYDSFVYNIAQLLGELDVESEVIRNDKITIEEIKKQNYDAIIISPGPGTPEDEKYFGICTKVIKELGPTTPILGVCLGHQGIIHAFGGKVVNAGNVRHGKTSPVEHT